MPRKQETPLRDFSKMRFDRLPSYLSIEGEGTLGYKYQFGFCFERDRRDPYIRIHTEHREEFLKQGTEEQAQAALINLATEVRKVCGGFFDVHSFYGLVWGTKLTPVAPGFMQSIEGLNEGLTIIIHLTDTDITAFDEDLSDHAIGIGTEVSSDNGNVKDFITYMQTKKKNPNQFHRDIALANNLGIEYETEIAMYSGTQGIPKAMGMTPTNISWLMYRLKEASLLKDLLVTDIKFPISEDFDREG